MAQVRFIAAFLAGLATSGAFAHGFMERASPAAGSTVHGPPASVQLWFSQPLEPAFSTLRVLDRNGKQVDRMDQRLDAGEPKLLRVSLPPLAPGSYRVLWRALSVDGHVTKGALSFVLAP